MRIGQSRHGRRRCGIGQSRRRHHRCSRGRSSTAACTPVLRFHSWYHKPGLHPTLHVLRAHYSCCSLRFPEVAASSSPSRSGSSKSPILGSGGALVISIRRARWIPLGRLSLSRAGSCSTCSMLESWCQREVPRWRRTCLRYIEVETSRCPTSQLTSSSSRSSSRERGGSSIPSLTLRRMSSTTSRSTLGGASSAAGSVARVAAAHAEVVAALVIATTRTTRARTTR